MALVLAGAFEDAPALTWDGRPEPTIVHGGVVEAGPDLYLPWICDTDEYCTQGHNGGSHTGSGAWAWDFALQEGEEIWAASAGTVSHLRMDSTSGGCDTAYINDMNYVVVDHGDGTSIAYLHMTANTSPLAVGETVEVGDLVARVGATGYACGAHLHLQVMETCGGSYCNSLQGNFVDFGDPVANMQLTSNNCPECTKSLDGGETTIDDEDAGCLRRETAAWSSSFTGEGGHHFVTRATDAGAADSIGTWRFGVTTSGDYRVEVFVPDVDAETTNATYEVSHADGVDTIAIDQSTQKGWQELGVFAFVGGSDEHVRLPDNTGESLDLQRAIAYDAVRFTFMPSAGTEGGGSTGGSSEGESEGGGTQSPDESGSVGSSPSSGGSSPGSGNATSDASATDASSFGSDALPPGRSSDGSSCACRSDEGSLSLVWLLVLFAGGSMLRRREALRPRQASTNLESTR